MVAAKLHLVPREEGLRRALQDWMKDDTTFRPDARDELSDAMQDRVGDEVDFVVTGHTHLARALRTPKNRAYFNSGTWIRLLRLTPEVLASGDAFERHLWKPLTSGRIADLDTAKIPGKGGALQDLVFDRTNAVRIARDGNRVVGELLRVNDGADEGTVRLELEEGTEPFTLG